LVFSDFSRRGMPLAIKQVEMQEPVALTQGGGQLLIFHEMFTQTSHQIHTELLSYTCKTEVRRGCNNERKTKKSFEVQTGDSHEQQGY